MLSNHSLPNWLKKTLGKIALIVSKIFGSGSLSKPDPVFLGFWKDIHGRAQAENRPLYVLAPMADVTDCAFRKMINKYGKPDVTWTEFVSADGLMRATPEGKSKLMRDLLYNVRDENDANNTVINERPIVAQLFSSNPEYMKQACKLVADLGYDGIDINMGCPDKGIEKQGCGSAMIKTPKKAQEIIRAAKEGAVRADGTRIPVTVKTRIGYNKNELETWLPALLEAGPAVITLHARTRKEMSKVPARWEHVARAVEIRDAFFAKASANIKTNSATKSGAGSNGADSTLEKTLILGNGDVLSIQDGYEKCKATGADGAMLGRAIFGNPWLFRNLVADSSVYVSDNAATAKGNGAPGPAYVPTIEEKLNAMVEHTQIFETHLGDIKNFAIMKKHYKAYVNGFDGAKELRMELMEKVNTTADVKEIIEEFLKSKSK
ncbi:MAG: tRNA-dihydrouridine synthase [Patescibacteria group bacterium]|nr:tRNA-dihydrouridine synthase [Patescibacteria group bacterium]